MSTVDNSAKAGEKLDAFVVRRAGYYCDRWTKFRDTPGTFTSFNWAACLGQVIWLAYRKLYLLLILAVLAYLADFLLVTYFEDRQLLPAWLIAAWNWVATVLFFAVFGFLGNYAYWRKFRRVERWAGARYADAAAQLEFIRSKGGVNPVGAWLVVIVLLLPVAWALYWGVYQASRFDYSAMVLDAEGPLTLNEIEANFLRFMEKPIDDDKKECVFREIEERARAAGDPETLDPMSVELLPKETWDRLDPEGKRLILTQAIVTKAFFACNRVARSNTSSVAPRTVPSVPNEVIVPADPRFDVFERSNSAGDGTFASPNGIVVMSFRARDSRYCRTARFSSDYTVVLACRNEQGWEVEASSTMKPGESTAAANFGGGDMTDIANALRNLQPGAKPLNEQEIIEAASRGWR